MEQPNFKVEVLQVTDPGIALNVLWQALEIANQKGTFSVNDSAKIHASFVCLLTALKDQAKVTEVEK